MIERQKQGEKVSEREVQVSFSWMAVLLWELDVGSLFPKKSPLSFLPSFLPFFPLSVSDHFILLFRRHAIRSSFSFLSPFPDHIPPHASPHPRLSLSRHPSLSPPTHSPLYLSTLILSSTLSQLFHSFIPPFPSVFLIPLCL